MEEKPSILSILDFFVLHAAALATLWIYGPSGRELMLVGVYAGVLVLSAIVTQKVIPPLLPSLVLVAVVAGWRILVMTSGA